MSKKLFVGGLSWGTNDESLRQAFARFGTLEDVAVVVDRDTGRSRGFGFVSFADAEQAQAAKDEMNGTDLDGRSLRVDFATERGDGGRGSRGGRHKR